MTVTARRFAPFVLAGAAAMTIVAAPAASAAVSDPHLACVYQGEGNSECQSPGNAQLTATPQTVTNPQEYPFLFGGPLLIFHHGGNHR